MPGRGKQNMKTADHGRRILLFGGTTEGRRMARILSEHGIHVTVCVATRTGADCLREITGLRILTGRKDAAAMSELMREGYDCCIDATHPYAVEAGRQIRKACAMSGLPCYRLLRRQLSDQELHRLIADSIRQFRSEHDRYEDAELLSCAAEEMEQSMQASVCKSAEEACALLEEAKAQPGSSGGILLTCGAKEAACFSPLLRQNKNGVYIRTLPSKESIRICLDAGFPREQILTGWGPYSVEENVRTLEDLQIRYLVTKDGGWEGGYPQKLAGAALCGAKVIVIERPAEDGYEEGKLLRMLGIE